MVILLPPCNELLWQRPGHIVLQHRHSNKVATVLWCNPIAVMTITEAEESHLKLDALVSSWHSTVGVCRGKHKRWRGSLMYAASHSSRPSVIMTARSTTKLKLYSLYLLHGTVRSTHLSTAMCCQKFWEKQLEHKVLLSPDLTCLKHKRGGSLKK